MFPFTHSTIDCRDRILKDENRLSKMFSTPEWCSVSHFTAYEYECTEWANNVRDSKSYSNFLSKLKTHYFNVAFYNHILC